MQAKQKEAEELGNKVSEIADKEEDGVWYCVFMQTCGARPMAHPCMCMCRRNPVALAPPSQPTPHKQTKKTDHGGATGATGQDGRGGAGSGGGRAGGGGGVLRGRNNEKKGTVCNTKEKAEGRE